MCYHSTFFQPRSPILDHVVMVQSGLYLIRVVPYTALADLSQQLRHPYQEFKLLNSSAPPNYWLRPKGILSFLVLSFASCTAKVARGALNPRPSFIGMVTSFPQAPARGQLSGKLDFDKLFVYADLSAFCSSPLTIVLEASIELLLT